MRTCDVTLSSITVTAVEDGPDSTELCARQRVGTVLNGKYHLNRLLGCGGMAAVYEATHRNELRVAVKILHPFIAANRELKTRFLREGTLANSVDHPGVVRVTDDDVTADGIAFLVMELLDGEVLSAELSRSGGQLPLVRACDLMLQLLDVLAAAHVKGIVHRDLKPDNLFVLRSGALKVLDFGIARLNDPTSGAKVTRTGVTMGTAEFMAPEQALGRNDQIDGRTDLYATGATLFTLLSGRHVHEGVTSQETMILAATRPARSLREVSPNLPEAVIQVVDGALRFNSAERWPDATSMARALADACGRASRPSPATAWNPSGTGTGATHGHAVASGTEFANLDASRLPGSTTTGAGVHVITGTRLSAPTALDDAARFSRVPPTPPQGRKSGLPLVPIALVVVAVLVGALALALAASKHEVAASPVIPTSSPAGPRPPAELPHELAPAPPAEPNGPNAPRPSPVVTTRPRPTANLRRFPVVPDEAAESPAPAARPIAPPAPPPAPAVDCSVPYRIVNGVKRVRPECD